MYCICKRTASKQNYKVKAASLQKTELQMYIERLKEYATRIEMQNDKGDLLLTEAGAGQLYFR